MRPFLLRSLFVLLAASAALAEPRSSNPQKLIALGNRLVFAATTPEDGTELWITDGTRAGTIRLTDAPGTASTSVHWIAGSSTAVYFYDLDGRQIWRTDGTPAGTVPIVRTTCGPALTVAGTVGGQDVINCVANAFATNGTKAGTRFVGLRDRDALLAVFDGALYAAGDDGVFRSDDAFESMSRVLDGKAKALFVFGDSLFALVDGALWRIDHAAPPEQILLLDYDPQIVDVAAGESAFYLSASTSFPADAKSWKSDGTAAGTTPLGPVNFTSRSAMAGGNLVYSWSNVLKTSDGTAAGTGLLVPYLDMNWAAGLNGFAVIAAQNTPILGGAKYGSELWRADGTPAGTRLVRDINPGTASSGPESITVVNGVAYFAASDPHAGRELWRSDGTEKGTWLVANLAREAAIEGQLRDADSGAPIAGATVRTWLRDRISGAYSLYGETLTDAAGRFAAEGLSDDTFVIRTANASGYVDETGNAKSFALAPLQVVTGVEIALRTGARIEGRVTDAGSGARVSEAAVSIFDAQNRLVTSAVTDGEGRYLSNGGVSAGTYRIEVSHPSYNKGQRSGVAVQSGTISGADVALRVAGEVHGRVTDEVSGAPISFMDVTILDAQSKPAFYTMTGSDGTYRLALPDGTYSLSVSRADVPVRYVTTSWPGTFTVSSGTSQILDLSVKRARPFIEGRVLDDLTGLPVPGVNVSVGYAPGLSAETAAEGTFSIQGDVKDGTYRITINHPGYRPLTVDAITVSGGTSVRGLELRLRQNAAVRGRVVDVDGNPIGRAYVSVCPAGSSNHCANAPTAASGLFLTPNSLTPGVYTVKANGPAGYEANLNAGTVTVPEQGLVEINATLNRYYRVSGRVIDARTRKGIEGVNVRPGPGAGVTTAFDGTYSFFVTYDPPFVVTANASDYAQQQYPGIDCVKCGADQGQTLTPSLNQSIANVDFALHRATGITGRVLDAETREPVERILVSVRDDRNVEIDYAMTDVEGHYTTSRILGNQTVRIIPAATPTYLAGAPRTIEARDGTAANGDLLIDARMVDVTYDVLDASTRQPVAGASVELFTRTGIPLYRSGSPSSAQGKINLRIGARSYWTRVTAPGYVASVDNVSCGASCTLSGQVARTDFSAGTTATVLLYRVAIDDVRPRAAFDAGGRRITIRGEGFKPNLSVLFGSANATVLSVTPTEIVVTAPPNLGNNSYHVTVTNNDGTQARTANDRLFVYYPVAACSALVLAPSQTFLSAWQWRLDVEVTNGGQAGRAWYFTVPGRPKIALWSLQPSLQDSESYAVARVTSGCDEQEVVFRLDKRKRRSAR